MLRTILKLICLVGLSGLLCFSQDGAITPEKKQAPAQVAERAHQLFYQLTFVARELENDRVVNSRSYSTIVSGDRTASLRVGSKVPFAATTGQKTEWQQLDVGINIDCGKLEELGDKVSLHIGADISSLADNHGDNAPPGSVPVLSVNRWESTVVVLLKQPTVIYSSDDPVSKRKMQFQLTVAPIR